MGTDILAKVDGVNGQLELTEDRVRITRSGLLSLLNHGLKGCKEIFISEISSIQYKEAGLVFNGYIQFAFRGGLDAKGGLFEGTRDENTVVFNWFQRTAFRAFKKSLDDLMLQLHAPRTSCGSLVDIEQLARLRDMGLITEEEFSAKKRQILGI